MKELLAFGPPYGVVGPVCKHRTTYALDVDFVHRTHHDIFPTHYAPSLMRWFMDDWMTQVYGRHRAKQVKSVVITELLHGYYTPPWNEGRYLRGEKFRGRAMLELYMSHTPNMTQQLTQYRKDEFDFDISQPYLGNG